ncbi:MAG: DUF4269 domain-containing protein [Nesterenkonia sp.]
MNVTSSGQGIEELLLNTAYLWQGSCRQRSAAETLVSLRLDEVLGVNEWALAGTVPLAVDVPGSDLDVLICSDHPERVRDRLCASYSQRPGFATWSHSAEAGALCVAFNTETFPVEFFIQNKPVREQRAFRHMVTEYVLLEREGEDLRGQIKQLKASGLKTEPAFAQALRLQGDPYLALLNLRV